jgi:predicted O-linked N-acetylglucosamine transferase (SPINDLY family)
MPAPTDFHAQALECMQRQQWGKAVGLWQQQLQAQPENADAALSLSTCLRHLQLIDEAVVMAKTALAAAEAKAGSAAALAGDLRLQARLHLAHLQAQQQRHDEAGAGYNALLGQPGVGLAAAVGLSQLWLKEGHPSRAAAVLAPLAHLAPREPELAHALALAYFEAGDAQAAIEVLMPANGRAPAPAALSNALMFASYVDNMVTIHDRLRPLVPASLPPPSTGATREAGQPSDAPPVTPEGAPLTRRLRVGWVSADFYAHPVAYFLAAFLPHLRDEGVDCTLFSNGDRHDAWTERLIQAAGPLRSIIGLSTDAACEAIAQEAPDILIDLSGHTQGHRLDVFARRACRVQASYLGYFASTFVPAMDWVITDRLHAPPAESTRYSERLAYLPTSRFCWAPPPDAPAPGPAPSLRNPYTTFGAFTNLAKISEACVAQWAQVLQAVPGSRLQLRWKSLLDAPLREALRQRFAAYGIAPGRIEMMGATRHSDMMAGYGEIDVVLDTFPFSGATTSCEALWMGVPVITRSSDRAAGRQTASLLQALGASGWIAHSEAQFVALARDCALDTAGRVDARSGLRQKMAQGPLMDGRRFAQDFAQVLRALL